MSLSGQDLTEPIAKSGAHIFRLTGFLGDDQSLHSGGRPFAGASRDYRDENIKGTQSCAGLIEPLADDPSPRSRMMARLSTPRGSNSVAQSETRRTGLAQV